MKNIFGLLLSASMSLGCAPEPTDLLSSRPVAGGSCDPAVNRTILSRAACNGCFNNRLACTPSGLWVCLEFAQGELCERISDDADTQANSDAAVVIDAASVTDAATADVSVVQTDRPSPPSDAGPRIVGRPCTNGLGRCARTGMWVQVRPGVLECASGDLGARDQFETCDETGVDENCNGIVNEGCQCVAGQTRPCYTGNPNTWGVGICVRGIQVCDAQGRWSSSCMNEVRPGNIDICNNQLDDDCNGLIDETPCPSPR